MSKFDQITENKKDLLPTHDKSMLEATYDSTEKSVINSFSLILLFLVVSHSVYSYAVS